MTLTDNKADDLREQVQLWRNHYARSFPEVFDTERMKLVQKGILEILDATLALIDADRKKLAEEDTIENRIMEWRSDWEKYRFCSKCGNPLVYRYHEPDYDHAGEIKYCREPLAELSQNLSEKAKE